MRRSASGGRAPRDAPGRLLSWLPFVVYSATVRTVRRLPRAAARRLGRALGLFSYLALSRRRRLAAENVARALPGLGAAERRRVVRASFVHYNTLDEVNRLVEALDGLL